MCGIAGKFSFNSRIAVSHSEIQEMAESLRHRGPDDTGITVRGRVGLANTRLAIIDLSPQGHQPMCDDTEKIWIVFNGEIYNYQSLRKDLQTEGIHFRSNTDTEVIIYLYKKYGLDCLGHLRGMFAFALWDEEKQQLFLARDRVGKKPLKYYYNSKCFLFASELKAILKNAGAPKEVDFGAIDEYLTYRYVPHPKTGFKNIWKLEPGHYLLVHADGNIEKKKYWELDYSQKLLLSEQEWEKIIQEKLQESVKLRLVSDVPLGVHLSGGIDSSIITALVVNECSSPLQTFSIGFKESEYNELPYARLVAQRYHTIHHEYIVEPKALREIIPLLAYHYEEPYADSSALPTWYLCSLTKSKVTVALNGDGGDENFAGYTRYTYFKLYFKLRNIPFKNQLRFVSRALYSPTHNKVFKKSYRFWGLYASNPMNFYQNLMSCFSEKEKRAMYCPDHTLIQYSRWRTFLEGYWKEAKNLDWLDQTLSTDINSYLPDDLLTKVDIASMAHGLEVRSPFLDHEFLELTAKIPPRLKLKGYTQKYLLKKLAYQLIPKECIERPKKGFATPLRYWFREISNEYLTQELLDKKFIRYGFDPSAIQKLIRKQLYRHDATDQLWTLLMLRAWFRQWFD